MKLLRELIPLDTFGTYTGRLIIAPLQFTRLYIPQFSILGVPQWVETSVSFDTAITPSDIQEAMDNVVFELEKNRRTVGYKFDVIFEGKVIKTNTSLNVFSQQVDENYVGLLTIVSKFIDVTYRQKL